MVDGTALGGFGLHTVNCTDHPYGKHSLMDIEQKIHKEWGDFKELHPFMDYNVGLWTTELSEYVIDYVTLGIPFVGLRWIGDDDNQYFSVIVNPCGYVVLELMSDRVSNDILQHFKTTEKMRFSFKERNNRPANLPANQLAAIKVSRATHRMEDVKKFYTKEIGVSMIYNKIYLDGSEHAIFMFDVPANGT